jgi:hypothetical protein
MNIKHRHSCRICGNPHLTQVIDLGNQFFQGSFVKDGVPNPPTRKTPNVVVRCDTSKYENACGLIQTAHTIPPQILYTNYWYQSGISMTMRNHLKNIVKEALEITGFKQGSVLDIASNDNTLLRNYSEQFVKFGVDPSDIARKQTDSDITVVNDIFPTPAVSGKMFDIITSIACYYDVEDPRDFAIKVKEILSRDGIWIFEVAYWPSMLKNLSYDSIVNEHIIHYHLAPLEILFKSIGLKIFNAIKTTTNGGSIKIFVCHADCQKYDSQEYKNNLNAIRMEEFDGALDEDSTYEDFRRRVYEQKDRLIALIKKIKEDGKKVHIYGASTKLNTILNFCGIDSCMIEFAAERSPEKWGAKTISGIKLIPEEESRSMNPDYYLVGPYHFKEEILEREKESRSKGTKFIFPLPELTII